MSNNERNKWAKRRVVKELPFVPRLTIIHLEEHFGGTVERGSSVVECRTRNQVSPGSNPPLLPFGRLGIFLLSIDTPVDSAVYMGTCYRQWWKCE